MRCIQAADRLQIYVIVSLEQFREILLTCLFSQIEIEK